MKITTTITATLSVAEAEQYVRLGVSAEQGCVAPETITVHITDALPRLIRDDDLVSAMEGLLAAFAPAAQHTAERFGEHNLPGCVQKARAALRLAGGGQ